MSNMMNHERHDKVSLRLHGLEILHVQARNECDRERFALQIKVLKKETTS